MGPEQIWEWIGTEIAKFGLRWIVVAVLGLLFYGFFGRRYKRMKARLKALEAKVSEVPRSITVGNVYFNNTNILGGQIVTMPSQRPPDDHPTIGGYEIQIMTQPEYDAIPIKDEKTLYMIRAPENG